RRPRRGSARSPPPWPTGGPGDRAARLRAVPYRSAPHCRHFETCGGCSLQHLDAASYRNLKLGTLCAALDRVGIDPAIVAPMRLVPPERRWARLGLARPRDPLLPVRVGYRERFCHELIENNALADDWWPRSR